MKRKYLLILLIPFVLFLSEAFAQRPLGGGPLGGGGGGGGSVTGVGNCPGGPCLDGTSDGGTWLGIYDGNSHWWRIDPGDMIANETFNPMDYSGTGSWIRAVSPTFITNITTPQITLTGSDASPDAAGEFRYDSTVTAFANGVLEWYDGTNVRFVVDLDTEPTIGEDEYKVTYDFGAKRMYLTPDADTGGTTDYNLIDDPTAAGSISFGAHTGTYTSGTEAWGGIIFESTDADNAGDTTLITGKHYDDYDTNSVFLHFINDSDGGADDHVRVTGLGTYFGTGAPTETMDGQSVYITSFLEVAGIIYAKGGISSITADPKITLDDLDGANGFWSVQAADADDAVATFGVDDSNGDDQTYMEFDGVNERVEFKYPVVMEDTFATSYTIVTPQALAVTTEDDVTVGTELTSSVVMLTGDNDGDHDTLDLQNGITAGTILTFIVDDVCDDTDTLIIDAETDSTCTGCPDAGIFTFDDPGDKVTLYWGGTAWFYTGSYAVD